MPIQLNNKGKSNAAGRIRAGEISKVAWSFSASDGNKLLGGKDGDNWAEYGRWHLAEDTSAEKKTKARFKYPFGKNGRVYLSALRAIRSRSAQAGAASIFRAAGELLDMAKEKVENTTAKDVLEYRSFGELRSVTEEGIIEAYLTKWNTVDEYRSTFKEGSFKNTFQERGTKIKLIWNHEALIGHVIECREDQIGPFVKGQINMETRAGQDAHAHCKAGDVSAFSFGFNTIKDKWIEGIRHVSEVRCMECGPSIFPANEKAEIISVRTGADGKLEIPEGIHPNDIPPEGQEVRSEETSGEKGLKANVDKLMVQDLLKKIQVRAEANPSEFLNPLKRMIDEETFANINRNEGSIKSDEDRALDFDETVLDRELNSRGYKLFAALDQTLMDIWWSPLPEGESPVPLVDEAIQKFHGAYVEWANDYVTHFSEGRSIPNAGEITAALFEHSQGDLDEIAKTTSLTISELRGLQENKLLPMESRSKLDELPEDIQNAHHKERGRVVTEFCNELRLGGFSNAERSRFKGLLGIENKKDKDLSNIIDGITKLRESLKEKSDERQRKSERAS